MKILLTWAEHQNFDAGFFFLGYFLWWENHEKFYFQTILKGRFRSLA